jgi:hypothetical protein
VLGRLLTVGFGVWIAAQTGCSSKVCTLRGCGPAFEVTFRPVNGQWAAGKYAIAVGADGTNGACDVTLPLAPCTSSSTNCQGTRDWYVIESGCALPAEQHAIRGIVFSQTRPAVVDIEVSRDGRHLAADTFTLAYQTSQPNGPDCDPTCIWAPAATLVIHP